MAGDGDSDDRLGLAALAVEAAPELVESLLRVPGDREYLRGLVVLRALERRASPRRAAVMPGRFDPEPAGVPGTGLGDRALAARLAGAVLGRDEPELTHQLIGPLEAVEVVRGFLCI
jgi:hypothetical protein